MLFYKSELMENTQTKKPWCKEAVQSWMFLGGAAVSFALLAGVTVVFGRMHMGLDWMYFTATNNLGWLTDTLDGLRGLVMLAFVALPFIALFFSAKYGVVAIKKTATGEYRGRMLALVSTTLIIGTAVIALLWYLV